MLSILLADGGIKIWHLGGKNPVPFSEVAGVIEIQADGGELDFIRNHFTGLPDCPRKYVVRYFGDDARFVVGALPRD